MQSQFLSIFWQLFPSFMKICHGNRSISLPLRSLPPPTAQPWTHPSAFQQIQTASGVSGVSSLFELYHLYGFDPIKGMTVDSMHLVFNMLKREFLDKLWADLEENINVDVNQRDPAVGGLLLHGDFSDSLKYVNWTTEQRASGVAKTLDSKLGGWKHAELLKSAYVTWSISCSVSMHTNT